MSLLTSTLLATLRASPSNTSHIEKHIPHLDTWAHYRLLKQTLCTQPPNPPLPPQLLADIETLLTRTRDARLLTRGSSIPATTTLKRPGRQPVHIKLWQGDITTLADDVTAITNAANSQMLGCFQPSHVCIDNVIHSFSGPGLRNECYDIMQKRGVEVPPGETIVTKGYCLPSPYVIHTVGPQLRRGAKPTQQERQQLRQCYVSVLEEAEGLPCNEDGSKRVALCGISTGLFAFPTKEAARIAVETVKAWFVHREESTVTDVIFVTFAEGDYGVYEALLKEDVGGWVSSSTSPSRSTLSPQLQPQPSVEAKTLSLARTWLSEADAVIVTAGAGLSASEGLDYNSKALFKKHFPAFLQYNLDTLYSVFGFAGWPSEQHRWGYYFTHLQMIRSWPQSDVYKQLIGFLDTFGENAHVRTSNADGLFLANGWSTDRLSTPQGQYAVLQCLSNCRLDATFPTWPYLDAALPHLDPKTQILTDASKVPLCPHCGSDMMICVRAANWFNDTPFKAGETQFKQFRQRIRSSGKKTVILEIGAGMNTPGVLRWPNEDLVRRGNGDVKLVRIGVGQFTTVPEELEEEGLATWIDGDVKAMMPLLLPKRDAGDTDRP